MKKDFQRCYDRKTWIEINTLRLMINNMEPDNPKLHFEKQDEESRSVFSKLGGRLFWLDLLNLLPG